MECFAENDFFIKMLTDYGSIVLFGLLMLGIVALPIPEDTLLVFAGALMYKGYLSIPGTVLAAILGSWCGITLSYALGRTGGHYLAEKYGKYVGLTHKKLTQARDWFHRLGKWSLFVGYFIPGIRHFTGFIAGIAELEYHYFALYAYTGGIFWVTTFLTIGYFFGNICFTFLEELDTISFVLIAGFACTLIASIFVFKRLNNKG